MLDEKFDWKNFRRRFLRPAGMLGAGLGGAAMLAMQNPSPKYSSPPPAGYYSVPGEPEVEEPIDPSSVYGTDIPYPETRPVKIGKDWRDYERPGERQQR
jgi:hypothetical protein